VRPGSTPTTEPSNVPTNTAQRDPTQDNDNDNDADLSGYAVDFCHGGRSSSRCSSLYLPDDETATEHEHDNEHEHDVAVDARRRHEVEMELRFGPQAHAPEHGDEDDGDDNDNDVREEQRRRQWEERQMMDREEDGDRWAHHGRRHAREGQAEYRRRERRERHDFMRRRHGREEDDEERHDRGGGIRILFDRRGPAERERDRAQGIPFPGEEPRGMRGDDGNARHRVVVLEMGLPDPGPTFPFESEYRNKRRRAIDNVHNREFHLPWKITRSVTMGS
jgi:hypothetical protein